MICWHDAEHNRPAECGDHAGVVPAGLKRWCLNGQAEGGCVMTRLYAWLWQGCASLALAVLLVGLAAWGTSSVWAEMGEIGLQVPPCSVCSNGCTSIMVNDCPNTASPCKALPNCNCRCVNPKKATNNINCGCY